MADPCTERLETAGEAGPTGCFMRRTARTASDCRADGRFSRGATNAPVDRGTSFGDTGASMTDPAATLPRVRLRDVTLDDAELLDAWDAERSEYNDFGMPRDPTDREALARGPLRNERNGMLLIELVADGRPIGTVGWHREMYGPNAESAAFNFGDRTDPRGTWPRLRHRGAGPAGRVPLRHHGRPPGRGVDRRREHRRTTLAREGRSPARGGRPGRAVPGRRLSRPRHLCPASRRHGGLTGKLTRAAATVRRHGSNRRDAGLLGDRPRRLPRLRAPDPARTGGHRRARQAPDARRSGTRHHPPARLPARGAVPGRPHAPRVGPSCEIEQDGSIADRGDQLRRPPSRRSTRWPPVRTSSTRRPSSTARSAATRISYCGSMPRIGRRAGARTTTRSPTRSWPAT